MKTIIICHSEHHGNTEKIAQVITDVLKAKLIKPHQAKPETLKNYDLIGFGSGIYYQRHHKSLFKLVDQLPPMKNKKAFIFSTSGLKEIKLLNDFNRPLKKKLLKKGFQIIGVLSCRGFDTVWPLNLIGGMYKGRPNQEDLKQAATFATSLLRHSSNKDKVCLSANQ